MKKKTMHTIKRKILEYLGRFMRDESIYHLLMFLLQGKVYERMNRKRENIMIKNVRTRISKITTELFKAAVNKVIIFRKIDLIWNE